MSEVGLIKDGIVAVEDDKIIFVGQDHLPQNIRITSETITIDASNKLVTPGLIDSHTHLVYGGSREHEIYNKLKGTKYLDIMQAGGGIYYTVEMTKKKPRLKSCIKRLKEV